jgi:hypothetical protein
MLAELKAMKAKIMADSEIDDLTPAENAYLEQVTGLNETLRNTDIHNGELVAIAWDAAIELGATDEQAAEWCGDTARNVEVAEWKEADLMTKLTMTDGYVGEFGKTWETPTPEKFEMAVAGAMHENNMTREQVVQALAEGKTLKWGQSPNYYYDHSASLIGTPKPQRKPDYPNGRVLDCGCTVYWKHEVMSTSRGSSCEACYDRMSA